MGICDQWGRFTSVFDRSFTPAQEKGVGGSHSRPPSGRAPTAPKRRRRFLTGRQRSAACFFVLFLVLASFAACGGGDSSGSAETSRPGEGDFVVTADSAEVQGSFDRFFYVDVQVNGNPARFILDTGADAFLVSRRFADRLGLPRQSDAQISTPIGSATAEVRRMGHFQFSIVEGTDIDAAVVDIETFDGAIGLPFFRQVIISLDYINQIIRLFDPAEYRVDDLVNSANAQHVTMQQFVVHGLRINGHTVGDVRIDTGSAGGVHTARASLGPVLESVDQTLPTTFTLPTGTYAGTAFIASSVELGGFNLADQYVVFQEPDLSMGLVGNLLLQQFTLFLDLKRNEAIFQHDRVLHYEFARNLFSVMPSGEEGSR